MAPATSAHHDLSLCPCFGARIFGVLLNASHFSLTPITVSVTCKQVVLMNTIAVALLEAWHRVYQAQ